MRVGVTGAGGLLGGTLVQRWREAGADVTAWSHADLDVTDARAVEAALAGRPPDVVVHAAAWTDVDGAEDRPDEAMRVNAHGSAVVAAAAAAAGSTLIYVSTDYVFGGAAAQPLAPDAEPSPRSAYGASKAAGEAAVRAAGGAWLIARSGWLYGPGGRNFVDTMRRSAAQNRPVSVVDDQRGAPTSVRLVAEALWGLLAAGARGVWHVAAAGEASWHDVARAVYQDAGADPDLVARCTTAELGRPAPRPGYSVLDCRETARALGAPLPGWRDQLRPYVQHGVLAASGLGRVAA